MKRILSLALCLVLLLGVLALSAAASAESSPAADDTSYTIEYMADDGFYRVVNPNGGARLSYTTLDLIEVQDGGYTYAFKDLDADGELDPYEDWRLDPEIRAADLTSKLSLARKAGLMLHPNDESTTDGTLTEKNLVILDEVGARFILDNSLAVSGVPLWNNAVQAHLEETDEFSIPLNLSSDPKNTSSNAALEVDYSEGYLTIYKDEGYSAWPGNLGVAATFDPSWALVYGQIASAEYRAMGIGTSLSPQMDLATEPRWTRFSGTFGEGSILAGDMAAAFVHGFQSTWDGVGADAEDLGWGKDSSATMVKHYPGDGAAEGGREAHSYTGKYNVYPGMNLMEHVSVFAAVMDIEGSKTGGAAAVMPSYSIAIDKNGNAISENVASGYSGYKLLTILRGQLGFTGLICCDWNIDADGFTPHGVENLTYIERHLLALENGLNQFGGSQSALANLYAYDMGVIKYKDTAVLLSDGSALFNTAAEAGDGEERMDAIFSESAQKALEVSFKIGLFEDPYICKAESEATLTNTETKAISYECQKASVVMVKNSGSVISDNGGEKKTIYVPLTAAGGSGEASGSGSDEAGGTGYAVANRDVLEAYFNVVTDEVGPDGTLIRRTDFRDVDFALCVMSGTTTSGYISSKVDLDGSDGTIDNGYYPISLQYGEYYADPAFVRPVPLGLDSEEEVAWIEAGGEAGGSRYYGGKTAQGNTSQIEKLAELRDIVGDLPIVVYMQLGNPVVFSDVEPYADAILIGFSISQNAAYEVIGGWYEPNGLLPCQMPANMETVETQFEDVAFDMECYVDADGNAYDYAFGMNWSGVISDWRTGTYGRGAYADSPFASH